MRIRWLGAKKIFDLGRRVAGGVKFEKNHKDSLIISVFARGWMGKALILRGFKIFT